MTKRPGAIVTGATGFLGSVLVRRLLDSGRRVAVVVRKHSPNLRRLIRHPDLHVVYGDLDDVGSWRTPLAHLGADVFFHLAWKGVDNTSRNDPAQASNITSTVQTLTLAGELGCRRWVGTGSQAEYGPLNRRINEEDRANPTNLYGAAKLSACLLTGLMGKQIGIKAVWGRLFSIYGPGDNSGWMLIDVIRQLLQAKRPALTPGEQLWDYLYVEDAADALIALGYAGDSDGIYNLGSGESRSIRSIVETVRDMIDPSLSLGFGEVPYRSDQVMHLEADIGKIVRDTGWTPRTPLEVGLKKMVESIRAELK